MRPHVPAWRRLGPHALMMTLILAAGTPARPVLARHAPRPSTATPYRSEWGGATATPSTNPLRLMSHSRWRAFVKTALPQWEKYNPGPFEVLHDRRFERGETLVPPGGQTY